MRLSIVPLTNTLIRQEPLKMQDDYSYNAFGYPPMWQSGHRPGPFFPEANAPGPLAGRQHDVYPRPPQYYASQGEAPFPTNGFGHGGAHFPEPVAYGPQPGMGHGMPFQQPLIPMGQSPHLAPDLPYPAYPANMPSASRPYNFPQQISEPMVMNSPHHQGPAIVRDAGRGPYYAIPSHTSHSPLSGAFLRHAQLPVEPQPFGRSSGHNLAPQTRMPSPQPFSRCTGRRKALVIGINYISHPDRAFRLRHGVEDAFGIANFLCANLGFTHNNVCIMTDESTPGKPGYTGSPGDLPTKSNILREMRELVSGAQPHDSLFLYFSGHARQIRDLNGDEPDGFDETICAMDYRGNSRNATPSTPGLIVDDLMHDILVKHLPPLCRLTAIFDTCHSGTLLDLPYMYNSSGTVKKFKHAQRSEVVRMKSSPADVISLGACKDRQIAIETRRGGALRWAFIDCMTKFGNNLTYKDLIRDLREEMKKRGFRQQPLLSSSHPIDTSRQFII